MPGLLLVLLLAWPAYASLQEAWVGLFFWTSSLNCCAPKVAFDKVLRIVVPPFRIDAVSEI